MLVGFLDMASSSQTVPPSEPKINFSQIMEALAAIQGGMSTMQQSITAMQLEVHSINKRVEQNQLDLKECLKYHHPDSSDDEDDAPRTVPMAEDTWVFFLCIVSFVCIWDIWSIFCYVLLNFWTNITLFTLVLLRPLWGVIFIAVGFITLFYPLSLCDKKRE
jgi:hypothetical protein